MLHVELERFMQLWHSITRRVVHKKICHLHILTVLQLTSNVADKLYLYVEHNYYYLHVIAAARAAAPCLGTTTPWAIKKRATFIFTIILENDRFQ